jgi:hypothetical protein
MNGPYQDPSDKFYQWKGVKGPERVSSGMTEEEVDEKLRTNLKDHKCEWTQRGNEIFCTTGAYEHGIMIGTKKRLQGTGKGGEPILVDFVFVN